MFNEILNSYEIFWGTSPFLSIELLWSNGNRLSLFSKKIFFCNKNPYALLKHI